MTRPVEIIEQIEVPSECINHPFYTETYISICERVLDTTNKIKLLGTANTKRPELYAWHNFIASHVDNTGYVYFMILNEQTGVIEAGKGDEREQLFFYQGTIVRLNDYKHHSAYTDGNAICLFMGSYDEPCDAHVVECFKQAVEKLTLPLKESYQSAPRYHNAGLLDVECYALDKDYYPYKELIDTAQEQNISILDCSVPNCDKHAVIVDEHHPYFMDFNLCQLHAKKLKQAA